MSNPTPGPWTAVEYISDDTSKHEKDIMLYGPDWSLLATVHFAKRGRQQAQANARIMAASREMLDALELLLADGIFPTATHENVVRHAIAKARGPEADSR